MALVIKHNKVATLPDQPGVEINKGEWNENHTISSGSAISGFVLTADGLGGADFLVSSGGSAAGTNGQVQFNNAGAFGADSGLIYDTPNKKLIVGNNLVQGALPAAGLNNYLKTNGTNTASNTLLNAGVSLFDNGATAFGLDLGFANSRYRTRLYSPTGGDVALSYISGTLNSQAGFTDAVVVRGDTGFVGINTPNPTHTLTLPSTATGIVTYNTADQTINTERVRDYWSGNVFYRSMETSGTGSQRVQFIGLGTNRGMTIGPATVTGYIAQFNDPNSQGGSGIVGIAGAMNASSGINSALTIQPTVNQTATAGFRSLWVTPQITAQGSGVQLLADFGTGGIGAHVSRYSLTVDGDGRYFKTGGGGDWVTYMAPNGPGVMAFGSTLGSNDATLQIAGISSSGRNLNVEPGNATWSLILNSRANTNTAPGIIASSGTYSGANVGQTAFQITPIYNQTGVSTATDLKINRTETAVGSGPQKFLDMQVGGTTYAQFANDGSLTQPKDNVFYAIGNNQDVGITKKVGFPGAFTVGSTNFFAVQRSSASNVSYVNTFTNVMQIDLNNDTTLYGGVYSGGGINADNCAVTTGGNRLGIMKKSGMATEVMAFASGQSFTVGELAAAGLSRTNIGASAYSPYFSVNTGGTITGQQSVLATKTGVSATTTANTLAYTNTTGKTLVISQTVILCTAATSITTGPTIGIGTVAGTNDIFTATPMNALTTTSKTFFLTASGSSTVVPSGGTVYINLTAATGTSQTISVALIGFAY